jgi:hypothetical protein
MMTPNFFNLAVYTDLKKIHASNSISAKFPAGLTCLNDRDCHEVVSKPLHIGVAGQAPLVKTLSGQPDCDIGERWSMV